MKNIFRLLLLCSLVFALAFSVVSHPEARSLTGTYGIVAFQTCSGAHWTDVPSVYWNTTETFNGTATFNAAGTGTSTITVSQTIHPIYTPIPLFFGWEPGGPWPATNLSAVLGETQSFTYTFNFTYTVDDDGNYQSQTTTPINVTIIPPSLPSNPSSTFTLNSPNNVFVGSGYVMHNDNVIVTTYPAPEPVTVIFTNVPAGWTGGTTIDEFCVKSQTGVRTIKK